MTDRHDQRRLPTPSDTTHMLHLALSAPVGPVMALLIRLQSEDGAAWFEAALHRAPFAFLGDASAKILGGIITLEEVERLKAEAIRLRAGDDEEVADHATLGYFIALAAGLAHHRRVVSSAPRAGIDAALLELATALPEAWGDMLGAAALTVIGEAPAPRERA